MTTRHEQRTATRDRVLDAADARFRLRGYPETRIRDIAADAGVSVGTVMAVGDKPALLVGTFDRHIARASRPPGSPPHADGFGISNAGSDAGSVPRHASVTDSVVALLRPFLDFFVSTPALSRHYASILVSGTHNSTLFDELAEQLQHDIATLLRVADIAEPDRVARGIYLGYIGVLFSWASRGDNDAQSGARAIADVVSLALGVGAPRHRTAAARTSVDSGSS